MGFNSKYTGAQIEELLSKIPTTNTIWHTGNLSKLSQLENDLNFITDNALSGYLPITGGVINNTSSSDILSLKTTLSDSPRILMFGSSGNVLTALGKWNDYTYLTNFKSGTQGWELRLFDNNTIQFGYGATNYPILHSGNYTSYTYSQSSIDSKLSGYLPLSGGTIDGNLNIGKEDNTGYKSIILYRNNNIFSISNSSGYAVLNIDDVSFSFNSTGAFWNGKTIIHSGNIGSQSVNYATSAGSTTKLQTARTIWGQSFDGTGNVSGNMTGLALMRNVDGVEALNTGVYGSSVCLGFGTSENGISTQIDGKNIYLRYGTTHTTGLLLNSSGNVGIGTTSPSYKLDVKGDIHASGSITQDSDINLKNPLKNILVPLDDIAEAPLFEFTYKNDENKRIHVGTSAQYWVEKNNWFCKKQDNGYYDMEIQNLALASAISIAKEFKRYKEVTESTIISMKEEIEELKKLISNINK